LAEYLFYVVAASLRFSTAKTRNGHRRTPNILPSNGPDVFQVSSSDGYTAAF
jgi:hypothetical protein